MKVKRLDVTLSARLNPVATQSSSLFHICILTSSRFSVSRLDFWHAEPVRGVCVSLFIFILKIDEEIN